MARRSLFLCILMGVAVCTAARETGGFLVRGNAGYDVLGDNLVFGPGVGYTFPLAGLYTEVMVDLFASFYTTSETSGSWTYDETGGLLYVAAHYDFLFGYRPGETGIYALAGAGVFAGSSWWDEVDTYLPDGTTESYSGGGPGAGPLVDLGIGFTLRGKVDIRLDVPVLVFVSGLISLPIIVGVTYRF